MALRAWGGWMVGRVMGVLAMGDGSSGLGPGLWLCGMSGLVAKNWVYGFLRLLSSSGHGPYHDNELRHG